MTPKALNILKVELSSSLLYEAKRKIVGNDFYIENDTNFKSNQYEEALIELEELQKKLEFYKRRCAELSKEIQDIKFCGEIDIRAEWWEGR